MFPVPGVGSGRFLACLTIASAVALAGCGAEGEGTVVVKSPAETTKDVLRLGRSFRLGAPPVSETAMRR